MAIPTYEDFMLPVLQNLEDNKEHTGKELANAIAKQLKLTEEQRNEVYPISSKKVYIDRIGWARTYLKKAGLLDSPQRATYKITKAGLNLLNKAPVKINDEVLMQFESFRQFVGNKKQQVKITNKSENEINIIEKKQTPDDMLEYAQKVLSENLKSELIEKLKLVDPYQFEKIVLRVMEKMNYGIGSLTPKSHDDGIDGVIDEDELGLEKIYLQAKRYSDRKVDSKDMKDFIATLGTSSVKKGVFITTSDFIDSAKKLAEKSSIQGNVIVLVNGSLLASLMIKHNIGVQLKQPPIEIKKLDEDFFAEEE